MTNESQYEKVRRAEAANAVLENPAYQKAKEQMHQEIVRAWEMSDPEDAEYQITLRRLLHTLQTFNRLFEVTIKEGDFEAEKLKNLHKNSEVN